MPHFITHGTGTWKLSDEPDVAAGQEVAIRGCSTQEEVLKLNLGVRLFTGIEGTDITPAVDTKTKAAASKTTSTTHTHTHTHTKKKGE